MSSASAPDVEANSACGREASSPSRKAPPRPHPRPPWSADQFFMIHSFKVVPCRKAFSHDWSCCPYAHPGDKASRRDPRLYEAIMCPAHLSSGHCPRGDKCSMAHSTFEYHMHPSRYCTKLCKDLDSCGRLVCFFAHSSEELRDPSRCNSDRLPAPPPPPPPPLRGVGLGGGHSAPLPQLPAAGVIAWLEQEASNAREQAAAAAARAEAASSQLHELLRCSSLSAAPPSPPAAGSPPGGCGFAPGWVGGGAPILAPSPVVVRLGGTAAVASAPPAAELLLLLPVDQQAQLGNVSAPPSVALGNGGGSGNGSGYALPCWPAAQGDSSGSLLLSPPGIEPLTAADAVSQPLLADLGLDPQAGGLLLLLPQAQAQPLLEGMEPPGLLGSAAAPGMLQAAWQLLGCH